MNKGRGYMGALRAAALVGVLACSPIAHADVEADFQAGEKAFLAGDIVGAMAPLRAAADAGHARAQARLAFILDKSEFDKEAYEYYRKSAEQNDPEGQFGLAQMYAAGEGVEKSGPEALKWYRKAAEAGHASAINVLASAFINRELGLDDAARNSPEALGWIRKAADAEHVVAMQALAEGYRSGSFGLPVDVKQADEWTAKVNKALGIRSRGGRR